MKERAACEVQHVYIIVKTKQIVSVSYVGAVNIREYLTNSPESLNRSETTLMHCRSRDLII